MKVRKRKKSEIEEEEFKVLQVINKLASAEKKRQMWDLWWTYGQRVENFESEATSSSKTWNTKCVFQNSDATTRVLFKCQTNRAGS